MINDLEIKWKYVDDTSFVEIVQKGDCCTIPSEAELVQNWSRENILQLNTKKRKELIIDFEKQKDSFYTISKYRKNTIKSKAMRLDTQVA